MSDIQDAEPFDIYVDAQGKLWRCIGTCREPTVIFEEVEGHTPEPPNVFANQAAQFVPQSPPRVPILKDRKSGGINGLMWQGWLRVFRPNKESA